MDLVICAVLTAVELHLSIVSVKTEGRISFGRPIGLFLLHYFLFKFYRVYLYPRFFSPLRHLPGPQVYYLLIPTTKSVAKSCQDNNVILGQELNKFRADSPVGVQLDWSQRWPDAPFIRYLSIAGKEALVVNSLAAHRAVLQTHAYDFVKPPFFARLVGEITGVGLLFAEGEDHKHQRRLLAGPLSVPSMRKILPVFQRTAELLSKDFETLLGDRSHASIEGKSTILQF